MDCDPFYAPPFVPPRCPAGNFRRRPRRIGRVRCAPPHRRSPRLRYRIRRRRDLPPRTLPRPDFDSGTALRDRPLPLRAGRRILEADARPGPNGDRPRRARRSTHVPVFLGEAARVDLRCPDRHRFDRFDLPHQLRGAGSRNPRRPAEQVGHTHRLAPPAADGFANALRLRRRTLLDPGLRTHPQTLYQLLQQNRLDGKISGTGCGYGGRQRLLCRLLCTFNLSRCRRPWSRKAGRWSRA